MVEGYTVTMELFDGADEECLVFRKREVIDAPFQYKDVPDSGIRSGEPNAGENIVP